MPGELVPGFAAFILDNLEKGADLVHAAVSHGDDGVHGGDGVELVHLCRLVINLDCN